LLCLARKDEWRNGNEEEEKGISLLEKDDEQDEEFNVEGFPLLFYGVEGRDICDDDTPSFYNPSEALVVRQVKNAESPQLNHTPIQHT